MARSHAFLKTTIWTDPAFIALTVRAQHLFFQLLSQGDLSACGVMQVSPRRWARMSVDTDVADIEAALTELEDAGKVVVDHDLDELWFPGFVRHEDVLRKPNMVKALASAWPTVLSPRLRQAILDGLPTEVAAAIPDQLRRMRSDEVGAFLRDVLGDDGPAIGKGSRKGSSNRSRKGSGNPQGQGQGQGQGVAEKESDEEEPPPRRPIHEQRALPIGQPDDEVDRRDDRVAAAVELEIDRRLVQRNHARPSEPVRVERAWRAQIRPQVLAKLGPVLEATAALDPDATPVELLDAVSPDVGALQAATDQAQQRARRARTAVDEVPPAQRARFPRELLIAGAAAAFDTDPLQETWSLAAAAVLYAQAAEPDVWAPS